MDDAYCAGYDDGGPWMSDSPAERAYAAQDCREHCPVTGHCIRLAFAHDATFGVWGGHDMTGLPAQQRSVLRRRGGDTSLGRAYRRVTRWREDGWTHRQIAAHTGVARTTIRRLLSGANLAAGTVAAILAAPEQAQDAA